MRIKIADMMSSLVEVALVGAKGKILQEKGENRGEC